MELLNKIKKELIGIAPENWTKAYTYAYIEGEKGIVECFYIDEEENQLFQIESSEDLFEYICDFYDEYREENDEIWYTATFILEDEGELDVEFDYNDKAQLDDIERIVLWQYKYLDILPEKQYSYLIDTFEEDSENDYIEDFDEDFDEEEYEIEEEEEF